MCFHTLWRQSRRSNETLLEGSSLYHPWFTAAWIAPVERNARPGRCCAALSENPFSFQVRDQGVHPISTTLFVLCKPVLVLVRLVFDYQIHDSLDRHRFGRFECERLDGCIGDNVFLRIQDDRPSKSIGTISGIISTLTDFATLSRSWRNITQ